jgi:glycosyltransferase involved in cell wall biosynthesis
MADAPFSTRYRANAMADAGLEVVVAGFPEAYPSHGHPCRFEYASVWSAQPERRRARWAKWKKRLGLYWSHLVEPWLVMWFGVRLARERKLDLMYVSHPEPVLMLLLFTGLRLRGIRLPLVQTIAGTYVIEDVLKDRPWPSRVRNRLNHIACRWLPHGAPVTINSRYVADVLNMRKRDAVHLIHEGYENFIDQWPRDEARRRLGLATRKRMVLLFGVASRSKGADVLFKALEGLTPDFTVCVVGQTGGVYEPSWGAVEHLQQGAWKEDLVIVSRFVSEPEMAWYYAACDAVIIPYRRGFAATTTHLRRASEFGKAIIGSDQYLIGDTVRQYNLGLLFEPENVPDLRRVLAEFAAQPPAWFEEIRERSRRVVSEESWEAAGRMYRTLFERTVSKSSR